MALIMIIVVGCTPASIGIRDQEYSTKLTALDLYNKNLQDYDINQLKHMKELRELNLSSNGISDISPLKGLTNLTWLFLNSNQISERQKAELRTALPNCQIGY